MARKIHNVRVLVKGEPVELGEIQSETEPLMPLTRGRGNAEAHAAHRPRGTRRARPHH